MRRYFWTFVRPAPVSIEIADGGTIVVEQILSPTDRRLEIGYAMGQTFRWLVASEYALTICRCRPDATLVRDDTGISFVGQSFLDLVRKIPIWYEPGEREAVISEVFTTDD
jgi:hypothetical protein